MKYFSYFNAKFSEYRPRSKLGFEISDSDNNFSSAGKKLVRVKRQNNTEFVDCNQIMAVKFVCLSASYQIGKCQSGRTTLQVIKREYIYIYIYMCVCVCV